MSSLKDQLKNRVKAAPSPAHSQLIEPIDNTNVNVNVDENIHVPVNINENVNVNRNVYGDVNVNVTRPKKKKFEDKYTRQTYYIENELLEIINRLSAEEKGEKTRIVNEALKAYLSIT